MNMSLWKRFDRSARGALVGLSMLGCLAVANLLLADVSSAAVPPTGLNCVASDGKISGRGSTYQSTLQQKLAQAYRDDFCGSAGTESSEKGEAGNTMVAYNYPAAETASATGSGAGVKPRVAARMPSPGLTPKPGPWPNGADIQANVMSFPIGGSSEALPVHLTASDCEGTAPTSLSFTPREVSRIFGGDAAAWNDAELVATNPSLAKCSTAITRVVRADSSGTTNIFKQYLIRADTARTAQKCAEGKKWEGYFTTNTEWPGKQKPGEEGTCSTITTAATSGGSALIKKLKETPAGVGYADLADAVGQEGLTIPNVQNATGTSFQAPNLGKGANCTFGVLSLPGSTSSDAVGLDSEDNWANNNEEVNHNPTHENATDLGNKYPICGITFDLVYTGLDNGAVANPISRLTADQRRTLYAFFSFALSSTAQEKLGSINYSPLPSSWLPTLREGFQSNF